MTKYQILRIFNPLSSLMKNNVALKWSAFLSTHFGASLTLYHQVSSGSGGDDPASDLDGNRMSNLLRRTILELKQLVKSLSRSQHVKYLVENSDNWSDLIRQVKDRHANLLITRLPQEGTIATGRRLRNHISTMFKSPCPVLFVREEMQPSVPKKILVSVKKGDQIEKIIPVITHWAKSCQASILLSAYDADDSTMSERINLFGLVEKMKSLLLKEKVRVDSELTYGYQFARIILQRAKITDADLIIIPVNSGPSLVDHENQKTGAYFLKYTTTPLLTLSIPAKAPLPEKVQKTAAVQYQNALALEHV